MHVVVRLAQNSFALGSNPIEWSDMGVEAPMVVTEEDKGEIEELEKEEMVVNKVEDTGADENKANLGEVRGGGDTAAEEEATARPRAESR